MKVSLDEMSENFILKNQITQLKQWHKSKCLKLVRTSR